MAKIDLIRLDGVAKPVAINCSSSGMFSVSLPQEYLAAGMAVAKQLRERDEDHYLNWQQSDKLVIKGQDLAKLREQLGLVIKLTRQSKCTMELVIVYSVAREFRAVASMGRIFPCRATFVHDDQVTEDQEAIDHGDLRYGSREYTIGLGAVACWQRSRRYGDSVRIDFLRLDCREATEHFGVPQGDTSHIPDYALRLNTWTMLNTDALFSGTYSDLEGITAIPCTEEAANFFYTAIEALCRVGIMLEERLGGNEKTLSTISSGQKLLERP